MDDAILNCLSAEDINIATMIQLGMSDIGITCHILEMYKLTSVASENLFELPQILLISSMSVYQLHDENCTITRSIKKYLKQSLKVIPIFLENNISFDLTKISTTFSNILRLNGIELSFEYFDSFLLKLAKFIRSPSLSSDIGLTEDYKAVPKERLCQINELFGSVVYFDKIHYHLFCYCGFLAIGLAFMRHKVELWCGMEVTNKENGTLVAILILLPFIVIMYPFHKITKTVIVNKFARLGITCTELSILREMYVNNNWVTIFGNVLNKQLGIKSIK